MRTTTLGTNGPTVGRIGLGLMGMSAFYTGKGQDDAESIRTIHRALDLGVTLLDTAEMYGPYANEELLGRALVGRRGRASRQCEGCDAQHAGSHECCALHGAVSPSIHRVRGDHLIPELATPWMTYFWAKM